MPSINAIGAAGLGARLVSVESGRLNAFITKEAPVNPTHPQYGAVGDDATDNTAAFAAALIAAGPNGEIWIPPGTYRIGDLREPTIGGVRYGPKIQGSGRATVLKAKAGATRVLDFRGSTSQPMWGTKLSDLVIDGNAKLSEGSRYYSTDPGSNQGQLFDNVWWQNCSKGHHVSGGAATDNQSDGNTYIGTWWADCGIGLHIDSANAQEQHIINGTFATFTTAIKLSRGALYLDGGRILANIGPSVGLLLDGLNIQIVRIIDTITEQAGGVASYRDIDSTAPGFWPEQGLFADQSVFQGNEDIKFVRKGGGGAGYFTAKRCIFNNGGGVQCQDNDLYFREEDSQFTAGAAFDFNGKINCSRVKEDTANCTISLYNSSWAGTSGANPMLKIMAHPDGPSIEMGVGSSALDTKLYRAAADQFAVDDDFLINVAGKGLRVKEGSNAKMGTAVLVGGTVTVATTAVTANSRIFLTCQALGGTAGALRVTSRTASTSFVITSTSGTDTSTVAWMIVEPA